MEKVDIFRDITERTGGDIYVGVVGPVRTGKSTFIKKFMELLVIPNIKNQYDQERAKDELPQAAAGRMIMTAEPKFIPNEAVEVTVKNGLKAKVRLVDCVGYTVNGAVGYEEGTGPRMVMTPWFEEAIPFQEAAEVGTRKVITDHSTIGIVVTTDGTITDIPRDAYVDAEERVVEELKQLDRPFVILLNSTQPYARETAELVNELECKYDVPVLPVNCTQLNQDDLIRILEETLYEFPVREVNINLPRWVEELDHHHWLRHKLETAVKDALSDVKRLRDIDQAVEKLSECDVVQDVTLQEMNLGTGVATIDILEMEYLFYQVLEEVCGFRIEGDHDLFRLIKELSVAKNEYDKVAGALQEVREHGYGVVMPRLDDMVLEEPELIRQGRSFGVKLKARLLRCTSFEPILLRNLLRLSAQKSNAKTWYATCWTTSKKTPKRFGSRTSLVRLCTIWCGKASKVNFTGCRKMHNPSSRKQSNALLTRGAVGLSVSSSSYLSGPFSTRPLKPQGRILLGAALSCLAVAIKQTESKNLWSPSWVT